VVWRAAALHPSPHRDGTPPRAAGVPRSRLQRPAHRASTPTRTRRKRATATSLATRTSPAASGPRPAPSAQATAATVVRRGAAVVRSSPPPRSRAHPRVRGPPRRPVRRHVQAHHGAVHVHRVQSQRRHDIDRLLCQLRPSGCVAVAVAVAVAGHRCVPHQPPPPARTAGVPSDRTKYADWYCQAGYYRSGGGIPFRRTCSMTTGNWAGSAVGCSACGAGYYCSGGSSNSRTQCPAGGWARSTDTTLSSSSCSGSCAAGYYCPAGSTSPTQVRRTLVSHPLRRRIAGAPMPTAVTRRRRAAPRRCTVPLARRRV